MRCVVGLLLACICTSLGCAQEADTSCSPKNKKALEDVYTRASVDSGFISTLEDGNLRWLNVTVKFCKLGVVKALQAGKPAQPDQIIALINYDSLGEMVLTEKLRRACLTNVSALNGTRESAPASAGSTLRIVNDHLVEVNDADWYAVKGSIYNPNNIGVKNVVINYHIWKKYMGDAAPTANNGVKLPTIWKTDGGLVSATIMYLPPKQTVDFIATGYGAFVMTPESGLVPDPITAEITADWDH